MSSMLSAHQLAKRYPNGVLACDAVSFDVHAGDMHAVVGENGAGKSTLLKMLYGLEAPDAGEIRLDGRLCSYRSPADAIAAGIGLVPQHLELVPSMTVAENIVLGAEPVRGLLRLFDRQRALDITHALSQQHGLAADGEAIVADLSVGQQQRVAILKALHRGARVLLLDEPTALLSPQEADGLFQSLRRMAAQGLTMVLVTHKLNEVLQACDRFTVMRAGRVVGSGHSQQHTHAQLAQMIVGSGVDWASAPRVDARAKAPWVQVRKLAVVRAQGRAELQDIALDIAPGEILGIAGVEGNGQNRLADVLCGLMAPSAGTVTVGGVPLAAHVRHARSLGIGCVPEDRSSSGMAAGLTVAENTAAVDYFHAPASRAGVLQMDFVHTRARAMLDVREVHCRDEQVLMGTLSGGNAQKVILGRELQAAPRFLVVSQPTRGIDIGAAQGVRRALVALRDSGAAVLLVSADLEELSALCDRIAVLFEGRVVAHCEGRAAPRTLGLYMTGLNAGASVAATLDAPFTVAPAAMPSEAQA